VSPDYTEVQIYNGLQAFCSSLAGLIASRAVLEGHGIGNAEASATHAVLLTVLQDAFSRLTTIFGAYYLGTLLYPEAKTYRLVADITNDIAIVLDLLSPQLSAFSLSPSPPFIIHAPGSSLRVAALCLSGAFRALCGVAAGGAKAAITLHFAQDGVVPGDVGDLSAKDASKETVLALAGMLCGSMLMPYLSTSNRTYAVVAVLLVLHIWINYVAVRVVVMKTLNRQRATILWAAYSETLAGMDDADDDPNVKISRPILSPSTVASKEHLFGRNGALLAIESNRVYVTGRAIIGASLSSLLPSRFGWVMPNTSENIDPVTLRRLLDIFSDKKYVVGLDTAARVPRISIVLKDGHDQQCYLEAWITANTIASRAVPGMRSSAILDTIERSKKRVNTLYKEFIAEIQLAGWQVDTTGILTGTPKTISFQSAENRKDV